MTNRTHDMIQIAARTTAQGFNRRTVLPVAELV
jgi:hypothetical protein